MTPSMGRVARLPPRERARTMDLDYFYDQATQQLADAVAADREPVEPEGQADEG